MSQPESPETRRRAGRVESPGDWELLDSRGVGPFEDSAEVFRLSDGSRYVWESRRHRKRRGPRDAVGAAAATLDASAESKSESPWLEFYAPRRISWWIALVFIAGSALFTLGAAASLFGRLFASYGPFTSEVSYFAGAILFTVGIYLQLFEGLNSTDAVGSLEKPRESRNIIWFAWRPRRLDFMAPFVLLGGSLLFNAETSMALFGSGLQLSIGILSLAGSALFVVSTYLQFVEVCHRYLSFRPRDISWWIAVCNLVGSVAFVVGSAFGFQIPGLSSPEESFITSASFLFGSALFLTGGYLLLPEMFSE